MPSLVDSMEECRGGSPPPVRDGAHSPRSLLAASLLLSAARRVEDEAPPARAAPTSSLPKLGRADSMPSLKRLTSDESLAASAFASAAATAVQRAWVQIQAHKTPAPPAPISNKRRRPAGEGAPVQRPRARRPPLSSLPAPLWPQAAPTAPFAPAAACAPFKFHLAAGGGAAAPYPSPPALAPGATPVGISGIDSPFERMANDLCPFTAPAAERVVSGSSVDSLSHSDSVVDEPTGESVKHASTTPHGSDNEDA